MPTASDETTARPLLSLTIALSRDSNTMSTSPFQTRLYHDLLVRIVGMNADMFTERSALQSTCSASQVCQNWRTIILRTSSIWAKLLDLDTIRQEDVWWREELLRRSGQSLLWIKSKRRVDDELAKFVLELLDQHWQRIEKLCLHPGFSLFKPIRRLKPSVQARRLQSLTLPAPYLKVFNVDLITALANRKLRKKLSKMVMFSDCAPMIQEFAMTGHCFSVNAPWLQLLHALEIRDDFNGTITDVSMLLNILQNTPSLQRLVVETDDDFRSTTPSEVLPTVSLQQLSYLELKSPFIAGAIFLGQLVTPHCCRLNFSAYPFEEDESLPDEITRPAIRSVAGYARRYFEAESPKEISVKYFLEATGITFDRQTLPLRPNFRFEICQLVPLHIFEEILTEFSTREFAAVTQLKIDIDDFDELLQPGLFTQFFSSLCSIQVISPNEFLLQCLKQNSSREDGSDTEPTLEILLPALNTVKLTDLGDTKYKGTKGGLFSFLEFRQNHGRPIAVLAVTLSSIDDMPSISFLEQFTGLKVEYSRNVSFKVLERLEYICGGGHPEILEFSASKRTDPGTDSTDSKLVKSSSEPRPRFRKSVGPLTRAEWEAYISSL